MLNLFPFRHCIIPNFIEDENFLQNLKVELLELQFQRKSNDLYQFFQVIMPLLYLFSTNFSTIAVKPLWDKITL